MDDWAGDATRRAIPTEHERVIGGRRASFGSRLDRWVAEARVDLAAAQRARERWLQEVAAQEATLTGVLLDLAERRSPVAVSTFSGRRHRGAIASVGADFVALHPSSGPDVLVAMSAVAAVRTLPGEEPTVGDRVGVVHLTMAEVLSELAADRERVVAVTGTEHLAGELRSVGADIAVLRTDGAPPGMAYLPLATLMEVMLG